MTNTEGSSALAIDPGRASLFSKMAKVMGLVSRIPKNGYNDHHKYKYASADDVADTIRDAMAEANLALFVDMGEPVQETFEYTDGYGKLKSTVRTTIRFAFTFACGDSGATRTSAWTGQVDDNSDKAVSKCATVAEKYFLMKTFIVSAGDEPDSDADKHREEVGRKVALKWHEEQRNLDELSARAFTSGYTKERNGKGIEEIKVKLAPKTWADYDTGKDCWLAIKAAYEPTPPPDIPGKPDEPAITDPAALDMLAGNVKPAGSAFLRGLNSYDDQQEEQRIAAANAEMDAGLTRQMELSE